MTTIAKIKLYSPVALALVLLCISIVLIVITFSLVYWLHEISTGNNYGMWQGCLKGGDICGRWYENGQRLLNYNMTDSYKAFQATQVIYLAFTFFAFLLILFSLYACQKRLWMFVLSGFTIFIGTSSGIASLLVYVINVFRNSVHILGWCYWLSLGTIVLNLISLTLLFIFTVRLKRTPLDAPDNKLIKDFDYMSQSKIVQNTETRDLQEIEQSSDSPKIVHLIRTKEDQSSSLTDSPKHTHYHSEYDLSKPPKNLKNKKFHRRFHYRQIHKVAEHKKTKPSVEQFQPGYCSEPEIIEYSLDRCWINADCNVPSSFETIESIDDSFNYDHVLPKSIFDYGEK